MLLGVVSSLAPLLPPSGEIVKGSYIVVFEPHVSTALLKDFATQFEAQHILQIRNFKALGGRFSEEAVEKLRTLEGLVKYVEHDQIMYTQFETQTNATWGLDRVDQTNLPLDSLYRYHETAGAGVDLYIIDTGILLTHEEFRGRVKSGYDFHNNDPDATDDNGHGTHVASTTAGTTYGLAKRANLIAVKTLGRLGAGNLLNVARGVEYAAQQHASAPGKRSVANMSLGGGATQALDDAVIEAIAMGLVVVIASGNNNGDACNNSPARVPVGITVNAININDTRASFSNWGQCTHIFAPGQDITAAWISGDNSYRTISGTSMACPHVAGAAAVLLGKEGPMSPAQVKSTLLDRATKGVVQDVNGSPNVLLYSPYQ